MAFEPDLLSDQAPEPPPPGPASGSTVGDAAKTLMSGVTRQTAAGVGLLGDLAETPQEDRHLQTLLNTGADIIENAISPKSKAVAAADITTPEGRDLIAKNPVRYAAQTAANIAPSILAAMALPEGWAGVAAGSTFFGAQGVANQLNDTQRQLEGMSDRELQEKVPLYKAYREDHDEKGARQALYAAQNDARSLLMTGGANALAGGVLGHLVKGQAAQSFMKSLVGGAGEGALSMGIMGAGSEAGRQMGTNVTGEAGDVTDPEQVAVAGLNSAALGLTIGAVAGATRGAKLPKKVTPKIDKDVTTGRTVVAPGPDPAQGAAIAAEGQPADKGVTPPAEPAPATPAPGTPAPGTLADQIAKEEQARQQPPAQSPTPDVPQAGIVPPDTLPVADEGAQPPTAQPTAPVAPAPTSPQRITPEPPIPLPPTDRTNLPPRPKAPVERTAVPLEEPVETIEPVSKAEAEALVADLAKKEPAPAPVKEPEPAVAAQTEPREAPTEVSAPIEDLNRAVKEAEPEPKPDEVQPAEFVGKTDEGKSVFRVKNELGELIAAAKEKETKDVNARAADAERKRQARQSRTGDAEAKAEQAVKSQHPTDAEELQDHFAIEQNALGKPSPGRESAREILKGRVAETVAAAENAGVRIPERTPHSQETAERGIKNPTPYLSRLIELKKFLTLEKIARNTLKGDPAKLEDKLSQLYTEHVKAERLIRAGDLEGAAERRLEANEARNARHKAAAEKSRSIEEQAELDKLITDQSEETDIRAKEDHYAVESKEGVRHSTVGPELTHLADEMHPDRFDTPKIKATARLMQTFVQKVARTVGETPVHFVADTAKKAELNLGTEGRRGFFQFLRGAATKEGLRGEIFIDNDVAHEKIGPQVILHEAVHAATTHAIRANPKLRYNLNAVKAEAINAWFKKARAAEPRPSWTEIMTNEGGQHYLYGFKNEEEFMAEALADPRLRRLLVETPASPALVARLGLDRGNSLWRSLVAAVSRALGLGEKHYALMDAVLHLGDEAMTHTPESHSMIGIADMRTGLNTKHIAEAEIRWSAGERTAEDLKRKIEEAPHLTAAFRSRLRDVGLHLGTTHQVAQMGEGLFGPDSPAMRLWTLAKKMSHGRDLRIDQSGARDLIQRVADLSRANGPDRMAEFGEFLRDETMAGVYADRALKGQRGVTSQGKAQHGDLERRYNLLSKDERELRTALHDYFREQQNEAALATLKAIVRAVNPNGEADDALAAKIHSNTLSDAEKAVLDRHHVFRSIRNARALSRVEGPYVPLTRIGEHVVSGTYDVPAPKGATRLDEEGKQDAKGNVYQFDTKAEADRFAGSSPVKVTREQRVYLDPATGERFAVDPATGEKVKLTKHDWAANTADEKFRVTLQPKHLEFFEREAQARRRHAELAAHDFAKEGVGFELDGVAPRRYEPTGPNATFLSHEWSRALNSLRQRGGFQALDANARRELEAHLAELSLASLGSTRAQSKRLPRKFVKGASEDIQKGLTQYAGSMAGFLSRQEHMPEIDRVMKQMVDYQDQHAHEGTSQTYPRGQILKELQQRIFRDGEPERKSLFNTISSRLLQMSQLDKLASPAFHVINSMEPWTTTMPILAGKHGFGRAIASLHQAYADIGAPTIVGKGFKDTTRALRASTGLTDYVSTLSDRVKGKADGKELVALLKEAHETGVISKDAGMEIGRMYQPEGNLLGRGLDRADLMARQMGTAIESINRGVSLIAKYRLERADGATHEQAMRSAIDTTVNTMGDYSKVNAPPVFNHPVGRLALQFKKFGQKTYYLLGKTAYAALRGDTDAMKAFAGLMATHGLLAGALGLPLEAVHAGMLAAQLTGASQNNYGDFEQWVRGVAARNLGTGWGEIATRGIPRYLGVDVSSRFSLADLVFPLGDPTSLKTNDLLAYAAKAFGGAPVSLLAEYPHGVQALMSGDYAEAARVLVPIKVFADSMTAYQRASVGRQTASGREKMSPYTPSEAVIRSIGFAPRREAETMEAYGAQFGDQQRLKQDRTKLTNGWVNAKPEEKATAWRNIMEWNAQQPPAAKITMAEVQRSALRRLVEAKNEHVKGGIRTTKRDEFVRQQAQYYDTR